MHASNPRLARRGRRLLAAILVAAASTGVLAYGQVGDFNFNETTGLINIPTAAVAPAGSFTLRNDVAGIGLGASHGFGNNKVNPGDYDDFIPNDGGRNLLFGTGANLEFSVQELHGGLNAPVFGMKWLIRHDDDSAPAIAVGVQSVGRKQQPSNPHPGEWDSFPDLFVAASHKFQFDYDRSFTLTAGFGSSRFSHGFVGGELRLVPSFSILAEWDGTIESAGFRFTPDERWMILTTVQHNHGGPRSLDSPLLTSTVNWQVGLSIATRFGNPYGESCWLPKDEDDGLHKGKFSDPALRNDDDDDAPNRLEKLKDTHGYELLKNHSIDGSLEAINHSLESQAAASLAPPGLTSESVPSPESISPTVEAYEPRF